MAWGLEARVPFLDKKFLEVAMNVDPKEKMFRKGSTQEVDEDGRPRMEKVGRAIEWLATMELTLTAPVCPDSISFVKLSMFKRERR